MSPSVFVAQALTPTSSVGNDHGAGARYVLTPLAIHGLAPAVKGYTRCLSGQSHGIPTHLEQERRCTRLTTGARKHQACVATATAHQRVQEVRTQLVGSMARGGMI